MKICRRCGAEKQETDFYNDRSTTDGKSRICKDCQDARNKRYKMAHLDEISAYQTSYRQQHSAENAEYQKQYQRKHKETLAQGHREYYQANKEKWQKRARLPEVKAAGAKRNKEAYHRDKEKCLERNKRWRQTAAGQVSAANSKAKRRANIGADLISATDWHQIMRLADWKCAYCGTSLIPENRSLDHIVPLSKGGRHHIDNLVACCRTCNSKKGNKSVSNFTAGQPCL